MSRAPSLETGAAPRSSMPADPSRPPWHRIVAVTALLAAAAEVGFVPLYAQRLVRLFSPLVDLRPYAPHLAGGLLLVTAVTVLGPALLLLRPRAHFSRGVYLVTAAFTGLVAACFLLAVYEVGSRTRTLALAGCALSLLVRVELMAALISTARLPRPPSPA